MVRFAKRLKVSQGLPALGRLPSLTCLGRGKKLWSKWPRPVSERLPSKPQMRMEHVGTCCPSRFVSGVAQDGPKMAFESPEKAHDISFIIKEPLSISRGSISWNNIFSVQSISLSKGVFLKASFFSVEPSSSSKKYGFVIVIASFLSTASF